MNGNIKVIFILFIYLWYKFYIARIANTIPWTKVESGFPPRIQSKLLLGTVLPPPWMVYHEVEIQCI